MPCMITDVLLLLVAVMIVMNLFSMTLQKATLKESGIFSFNILLKVKMSLLLQTVAFRMRMVKFLVFLTKRTLQVPMAIVISTATSKVIVDSVGIVTTVSKIERKNKVFASSDLVERGK